MALLNNEISNGIKDVPKSERPVYRAFKKHVDRLTEKILDHYQNRVSSLIIFGSYSRGEFTTYSDLDVLIILNRCEKKYAERLDEFFQTIDELNLPFEVSPVILTEKEAERFHPLYLDISSNHLTIYDKNSFFRKILDKIDSMKRGGVIEEKVLNGRKYWVVKSDQI